MTDELFKKAMELQHSIVSKRNLIDDINRHIEHIEMNNIETIMHNLVHYIHVSEECLQKIRSSIKAALCDEIDQLKEEVVQQESEFAAL